MRDLKEITKNWEVDDDGYRICHINVDFMKLGDRVSIGGRVIIGSFVSIGDGARIGKGAKHPIDLGFCDGYRRCIAEVDGVAFIGAGCRWFTLQDAIDYWSNHVHDRRLTLCLMEYAKAIAKIKGWRFSTDDDNKE